MISNLRLKCKLWQLSLWRTEDRFKAVARALVGRGGRGIWRVSAGPLGTVIGLG